jgi:phenylacetate-CoA ligase
VPTERLESACRADLETHQTIKLKETIRRAGASPYYKQLFKHHDITEQSIQRIEDIAQIPFTTKKDIRDQYPFGLLAVPQSSIRRYHASSGTRGKPTLAPYTTADLANWASLCAT